MESWISQRQLVHYSSEKKQSIKQIKLKWFKMILAHPVLATNIIVMRTGIVNDINCSFVDGEQFISITFLEICIYKVILGTIPDRTLYRELSMMSVTF